MAIRIVTDSSSNMFTLPDVDYATVPLKVMFASREYVDQPGTDFEQMVLDLQEHNGPSTTSCPNAQEWLDAFEGHDQVFGITISSGLSASYASAEMAQQHFLEKNPGAKVHIFDSLATGPVMRLIAEKIREGILANKQFDQIKEEVTNYQQRLRVLYPLESFNNLANNGRVNMRVARLAATLNIRIIGHASDEGTIEILHKCRGEKSTLKTTFNEMLKRGFEGGKVHIDHCLNLSAAQKLKALIQQRFPEATTEIHPCTALCSYYADKGGLIIGYEAAQ